MHFLSRRGYNEQRGKRRVAPGDSGMPGSIRKFLRFRHDLWGVRETRGVSAEDNQDFARLAYLSAEPSRSTACGLSDLEDGSEALAKALLPAGSEGCQLYLPVSFC